MEPRGSDVESKVVQIDHSKEVCARGMAQSIKFAALMDAQARLPMGACVRSMEQNASFAVLMDVLTK